MGRTLQTIKKVELQVSEDDTKQHLEKLADAFFENMDYNGDCEFGSIGVDCKRPFGNSYVERDILEIIELEDDFNTVLEDKYAREEYERYARELYCQMLPNFIKEKWKMYRSNW